MDKATYSIDLWKALVQQQKSEVLTVTPKGRSNNRTSFHLQDTRLGESKSFWIFYGLLNRFSIFYWMIFYYRSACVAVVRIGRDGAPGAADALKRRLHFIRTVVARSCLRSSLCAGKTDIWGLYFLLLPFQCCMESVLFLLLLMLLIQFSITLSWVDFLFCPSVFFFFFLCDWWSFIFIRFALVMLCWWGRFGSGEIDGRNWNCKYGNENAGTCADIWALKPVWLACGGKSDCSGIITIWLVMVSLWR